MKLSRLLATLALIVAGLAVPASAAGGDPEPDRRLSPETVRSICTIFAGTYSEDDRLSSYSCRISDGTIICGDSEDSCGFQPATERLYPPPIKDPCLSVRGQYYRDDKLGQFACALKEGLLTVTCESEPDLCDFIGWIPSEQPMT